MTEQVPEALSGISGTESFISSRSLLDTVNAIPVPKVEVQIENLLPKQTAIRMEAAYVKKARELGWWYTVLLAWHAGLFFGLGSAFYGVVITGTTHWGLQRFAAGIAYSTGLSMVLLAGGELFTGNVMMLMAWMTKRLALYEVIWHWLLVYFGNLAGALTMAAVQTWGRTHENNANTVGQSMMDIAEEKCRKQWGACFAQATYSNILMCWAIWMAAGGRNAQDKQLVIILPVACFAAMGYEHIVSNFYFIPVALMIQSYAFPKVWVTLSGAGSVANLDPLYQYKTWPHVSIPQMIYANFIPTTCGNIVGALLFIVIDYWYLYLRDAEHRSRFQFKLGTLSFFASGPSDGKAKMKKKKNVVEATTVAVKQAEGVQATFQPGVPVPAQSPYSGSAFTSGTPSSTPLPPPLPSNPVHVF